MPQPTFSQNDAEAHPLIRRAIERGILELKKNKIT